GERVSEPRASLRIRASQQGKPLGIDHGGREDGLEIRLLLTVVTRMPESVPPGELADLPFDLGAWAQPLPERPSLLWRPLLRSGGLQDVLMEVQLNLPAGRFAGRVLDASRTPAQAAVSEGTGSTRRGGEAEEAYRPVFVIA